MDDNKIKELLEALSENVKDNKPDEDFEKKATEIADGLADFSNRLYIEALKSNGFEKAKLEDKINLLRGGLMLVYYAINDAKKIKSDSLVITM